MEKRRVIVFLLLWKAEKKLGEEYLEKEIVVKKVSRHGPTKITIEIVEVTNKNKAPFIR